MSGQIYEYRKKNSKSALIFIHGFSGDITKTWGDFQNFLMEKNELNEWDIFSVGYESTLFVPELRGIWKAAPDIQKLADTLATYLQFSFDRYSEIAIVAHSMGGLIVQRALLDNAEAVKRISHLFLFGTPSNGLIKAVIGSKIIGKRQIKNMAEGGTFITRLRRDWETAFGHDNFPFQFLSIAGGSDEFVPVTSSHAPFPLKNRHTIPGDHLQIVKPKTADDLPVQIVLKSLRNNHQGKTMSQTEKAFLDNLFKNFSNCRAILLFAQDERENAKTRMHLKQYAQSLFGEEQVFHIVPPSGDMDSSDYFSAIGEQCRCEDKIKTPIAFSKQIENKLTQASRLLLLITRFEQGNEDGNFKLASELRALSERFSNNLNILISGGEQLAGMYHLDGPLSLITHAEVIHRPDLNEEDVRTMYPEHQLSADIAKSLLTVSGGHPRILQESLAFCHPEKGLNTDECRNELETNSDFLWSMFTPFTRNRQFTDILKELLEKEDVAPNQPYIHDSLIRKLYWKNLIKRKGNHKFPLQTLLFIEEPEAHLHPKVQIQLMEIFSKLTKAGVKIVMTSHSNYMFNKMNNLVLAKKLLPEDIEVMVFDEAVNGSTVKNAQIDELGIDDNNFIDTAERLYEEKFACLF
ncbi:AAA family ATPase [Desulfobacterales bacterium HSG16]|nr:AAA family ATPase [Desulfobacterales bacterium HSG16]